MISLEFDLMYHLAPHLRSWKWYVFHDNFSQAIVDECQTFHFQKIYFQIHIFDVVAYDHLSTCFPQLVDAVFHFISSAFENTKTQSLRNSFTIIAMHMPAKIGDTFVPILMPKICWNYSNI